MKTIEIIRLVNWWNEKKLVQQAQEMANQKSREGYEIISISFSYNCYAYITIARRDGHHSFTDKV